MGKKKETYAGIQQHLSTLLPTEVAYLAGLFDGEGCVAVYHRIDARGYDYFQFQAKVSNTEKPLLQWVQHRFGGGVVREGSPPKGNKRQCFVWYVCNRRAELFFHLIRPYTVVKGPQIDLALSLRKSFEQRRSENGRSMRVPQEIRDHRLAVIAELKTLKGRIVTKH